MSVGKMRHFNFVAQYHVPFDQAWSRASKKVGVVVSIDQGPEKSESEGAENGPFPHKLTNEVACV